MFVTSIVIDNQQSFSGESYRQDQIAPSMMNDLISMLDGERHTAIILRGEGDAHMGVAGDVNVGLIVFATRDGRSFYNLLSDRPDNHEQVELMAGGQPGRYERRFLVEAPRAIAAAKEYIATGELAEHLPWETDLDSE